MVFYFFICVLSKFKSVLLMLLVLLILIYLSYKSIITRIIAQRITRIFHI